MKIRKRAPFGKNNRRKHRHLQVTVFYQDGERFARTYTDRKKAADTLRIGRRNLRS
jgi:hypothetical protein